MADDSAPFILPDLLAKGLRIVFCGTAAGRASALAKAYYAHPGNRFWRSLDAVGLTPTKFSPTEYPNLLALGIGLTDLAKFHFGNDDELPRQAFDRQALREKILRFSPRFVAFTSKNAATGFLDAPVEYGLQRTTVGTTKLFVLPSPSGQAARFFDLEPWHELARLSLRA